jgi:hypothetical protein
LIHLSFSIVMAEMKQGDQAEANESKFGARTKEFLSAYGVKLFVAVFAIACAIAIGWFLVASEEPSPRETALGAILLTLFSTAASFAITKVYAELGYGQTLRDHGVQIARNIILLKSQILKLTSWTMEKRAQTSAGGSPADSTLEHIEETLEGFVGMTDVALNGITQVIGDAWKQYQTIMEQMDKLRREESTEINSIKQEYTRSGITTEAMTRLQEKLAAVAQETEKRLSHLATRSPLPIFTQSAKRTFTAECPYCSGSNQFEISDRPGETRKIVCDTCSGRFNAHLRKDGQVLVRSDPLYLAANVTDSFEHNVRQFLVTTSAWIDPERLPALLEIALKADATIVAGGTGERSPHNLLQTMLHMQAELAAASIPNVMVRSFYNLLYRGRAFDFGPDRVPGMRNPYVSNLNEQTLLRAYLQAILFKIRKNFDGTAVALPRIARLILPATWSNAVDLVVDVFQRLPPTQNPVDAA